MKAVLYSASGIERGLLYSFVWGSKKVVGFIVIFI